MLRGDATGTAEPYCPKRYSIPYNFTFNNEKLGEDERRGDVWCPGVLSSQVTVTCEELF